MSILLKSQSVLLSKVYEKYTVIFKLGLLRNGLCDTATDKEKALFLENLDSSDIEEEKVEKLRNKSRLSPELWNIMYNKKPYSEPVRKHHFTVKYNRRMYGIYGSESGVNPGIMWPTKAEIEERREYEKVAYPFTIQEMVSAAAKERDTKELEIKRIHDQVVSKLAKLESWKKELRDKVAKKEAEALLVKEKKDKLIEEVRRHFGYKVDPRDDRFKEMLAQKQKEQKKAEKQARTEDREKKAISKLMETYGSRETS